MLNPILHGSGHGVVLDVDAGEALLLTKSSGFSCDIVVPGLPKLTGTNGQLVLTNKRLVYINKVPVPLGSASNVHNLVFQAFEFPLSLLSEERFNQPIFGANNITGVCAPSQSGLLPAPASFTITFREGGCGTFLHFFRRALHNIRHAATASSSSRDLGDPLRIANAAFVDPSDSSVIHVIKS